MMNRFIKGIITSGLVCCAVNAWAVSVQVTGLDRFPKSTVMAIIDRLPASEQDDSQAIIHALYRSGLFSDVDVDHSEGKLVIHLKERPVISDVDVQGYTEMELDTDIQPMLKENHLVRGELYDGYNLHQFASALKSRYDIMGYQQALITPKVDHLSGNRVDLSVIIDENKKTLIKHIDLIGNKAFSESTLMSELPISETHWWKFYTESDVYSEDSLNNALGMLQVFYYEHGYIGYKLKNKQVTFSEDRHTVDIKLTLDEGSLYRIGKQSIEGLKKGVDTTEYTSLFQLKEGEAFKRTALLQTRSKLVDKMGDEGYALSDIDIKTKVNRKDHVVDITYKVKPGRPMLVRNISIHGNGKTDERVLRARLIQLEDTLYSHEAMRESMRRLKNLPYIREATYKVKKDKEGTNWVDIDVDVVETFRTMATLQGGFDNNEGLILGLQYSQSNFIGSGNTLGINLTRSDYNNLYSVDYTNPNFTPNGVSMKSKVYYRKTDYDDSDDITSYVVDSYGYRLTFGFPISLHDRIMLGTGIEHLYVRDYDEDDEEIADFIDEYGDVYNQLLLILGWSHSNLDQAIFPTSGDKLNMSVDVAVPGLPDDIEYYRASLKAQVYVPVYELSADQKLVLRYRGSFGYGDGYGEYAGNFPFFRNFYAGGINTIRGIKANGAGPVDDDDDAMGGNVMLTSGLDLILPTPSSKDVRWSLFVDAGNVYEDDVELDDINVTTGIDFLWLSPIGLGIELSYGIPLEYGDSGDQSERFQFSLGTQLM